MKVRSIVLTLSLCFVAIALCYAADELGMGTWKLNEAKSKLTADAPKNTTVVYSTEGDKIKVTTDGVDTAGKPTHTEWTGKFDGKDYPLTGDAMSDTRSYTKVNDHTLDLVNKKAGKETMKVKVVVAPDGKSRTVTFTKGGKVVGTAEYDKQ